MSAVSLFLGMAFVTWLRALNAVSTVAEVTKVFRSAHEASKTPNATVETGATDLETGLANVVVAALKEAFDRDRSRFELEREAREAEHTRAERVLRLNWLRQTAAQSFSQVRLLATFSVTVWVVSAVGAGYLAPLPTNATLFLGFGWATLAAAVAAAVIAHQRLTVWLAAEPGRPTASDAVPRTAAHTALPWLLLAGFVLTAISFVAAL